MTEESPSLSNRLLIASEKLDDPNFRRAVVLIIKHDEEGSFGLILNRPIAATIKQVWNQVSKSACDSEESLHLGGPVQGPLMALHGVGSVSPVEILPGIYFTPSPDELEQLVRQVDAPVRFFVGYSGWGAGQLERELSEGVWHTLDAAPEHFFQDANGFWERTLRQFNSASWIATLGIKHVPPEPWMN